MTAFAVLFADPQGGTGVYAEMDQWAEVRRRVLTGELSKRAACREYGLSWGVLAKMLAHVEPPGYRLRQPRRKRKLEPFLPIIHEILEADRQAPAKQRHTVTRRHWGREQSLFDPVHYLALLERKPGGFDHARPLEAWDLPKCFTTLRRRMESDPGGLGTREFIRTLRLLESCSLAELTAAVNYALDIGIHDANSIRVILEHRRESPVGLFSLDGRPHLRAVAVTETSVSAYQTLLMEHAR